jgi:DNA polymerase III epsilon subunit-like protein
MNSKPWILLDIETTGLSAPIFVVELAAQRLRGWSADGEPFRKLLNQNQEIPAEASRVHGYTREILERDGEPPHQVYREFAEYAGGLPLVSFNLEYDLDEVLKPEWKRLRISPIGSQGLCALWLAQRLLDPVPAGNCKRCDSIIACRNAARTRHWATYKRSWICSRRCFASSPSIAVWIRGKS